jgi:hypothetical protein
MGNCLIKTDHSGGLRANMVDETVWASAQINLSNEATWILIPAISPRMTSFLGIWDTEDYLEVGPTKLLIYLKWPQQVAIVSVLSCGALAERNGHGKRREKSSI